MHLKRGASLTPRRWTLARDIAFLAWKSPPSVPFRSRDIFHLQLAVLCLTMSLPLLVGGGAECGPSANNPLRGLTKNFDQDRGVQQVRTIDSHSASPRRRTSHLFQDLLGPNRARSSNQVRCPWFRARAGLVTVNYPIFRLSGRIPTLCRTRT